MLAIFASRFLNNNPPLINEDGKQQRDFVSVHDITQACRLALEVPEAADNVFNVGSGRHYSIAQIADEMARVLEKAEIERGDCRQMSRRRHPELFRGYHESARRARL